MNLQQNKSLVYVYSKYSSNCKIISENLQKYFTYRSLCIDNPIIKKQIAKSKMNIKYVPCILVLESSGTVLKYEGTQAFNFMRDIVSKIEGEKVMKKEKIEDDVIDDDPNNEVIPLKKEETIRKPKSKTIERMKTISKKSNLEELVEEEIDTGITKEMSGGDGNTITESRDISQTELSRKQSDLTQTARQMELERQNEIDKDKRVNPIQREMENIEKMRSDQDKILKSRMKNNS